MSTPIGPYVTKPKLTRDAKRADSAPPEEGAPSAWQKSKRNAVAKVKAKLGADEYVRICEQYTTAQAVSSSMDDGVITAITALHKLSDMELLALFNIGLRHVKRGSHQEPVEHIHD